MVLVLQEELQLLDSPEIDSSSTHHDLLTAPLVTRAAHVAAGFEQLRPQYGVLGGVVSIHSTTGVEETEDPRLYVSTNTPFSSIVCGVQGSGKSHTVSVMLENMFIKGCQHVGRLSRPLAGLILYFGEGGEASRPCEAAWVGVSNVPGVKPPSVRVYVPRSSLKTMERIYSPMGPNVTVQPLLFSEAELDAEAFLSMMAVGSSDSAPLYMQMFLSILRNLGEDFSPQAFRQQLSIRKAQWNSDQRLSLDQRMSLLDSFTAAPEEVNALQKTPRFAAGQITIIDLSDLFIDSASACALFEIITRLFVRASVNTGKVLVVDEAHKYLSTDRGLGGLTGALCSLIRQQRHLGMRVIISTQEPTVVPPVLLDLCNVAILHRFSSSSWWNHLAKHVAADFSAGDAFDTVVKLRTGEAIVLAPSGLGTFLDSSSTDTKQVHGRRVLGQFGRRYMVMRTRQRVTADGGASILVVNH
ncbi:hypothetical protein JAAARDRAFT_116727 [Jaapia argillacea MUCL 33604]|uniref:Uncharacterized protein n=1 Tax=Jaapia argillacea MUCL 33604 TaxID=933084 RepID=A0A067QME6_9AGAM|nr:hypothetical protein JAAARDRAFT_116727 [Jaapia argillacea MUCL 33604]